MRSSHVYPIKYTAQTSADRPSACLKQKNPDPEPFSRLIKISSAAGSGKQFCNNIFAGASSNELGNSGDRSSGKHSSSPRGVDRSIEINDIVQSILETVSRAKHLDFDSVQPGTIVDERYVIREKIGAGAMGTVFRAQERALARDVALKLLHPRLLDDPDAMRRFELEGQLMSTLLHANISQCYRYGIWLKQFPYLAMEFLHGKTLRQVLNQEEFENKGLERQRALRIARNLCQGLAYAHKSSVLHRDIKPENIFLANISAEEVPKLLDFGLAKVSSVASEQSSQKNTSTGNLVGTVQYMSPEQCRGLKPTEVSDLYSLSCVLFEALCGSAPFEAENAVAYLHLHTSAERPLLQNRLPNQEVPEKLQAILNKGLAVDPDKRYQTAVEMCQDIDNFLSGNTAMIQISPEANEKGKSQSIINKAKFIFVILVPALLIAALAVAFYGNDRISAFEMQAFLRQSPDCRSYLLKLNELTDRGSINLLPTYLHELSTRYSKSEPSLSDIELLFTLSSKLHAQNHDDLSRQANQTVFIWLRPFMNKQLKANKQELIPVFEQTLELELEMNRLLKRYADKRIKNLELVQLLYDTPPYTYEAKTGQAAANLYLSALGNSGHASGQELFAVYRLLSVSASRLGKGDEQAVEIRRDAARRLGEESVYYLRILTDISHRVSATMSQKLLQEVCERDFGANEKVHALQCLARSYCLSGEHQKALSHYNQAYELLVIVKNIDYLDQFDKKKEFHSLDPELWKLARQLELELLIFEEQKHLQDEKESNESFERIKEKFGRAVALLKTNTSYKKPLAALVQDFISINSFDSESKRIREFVNSTLKQVKGQNNLSEFSLSLRQAYIRRGAFIWLFKRFLSREPASEGLRSFSLSLTDKNSAQAFKELVANIAGSDEFKQSMQKLSERQKILCLYEHLLSRHPIESEISYWLEILNKNGFEQTVISFASCDEFKLIFSQVEKKLDSELIQ